MRIRWMWCGLKGISPTNYLSGKVFFSRCSSEMLKNRWTLAFSIWNMRQNPIFMKCSIPEKSWVLIFVTESKSLKSFHGNLERIEPIRITRPIICNRFKFRPRKILCQCRSGSLGEKTWLIYIFARKKRTFPIFSSHSGFG